MMTSFTLWLCHDCEDKLGTGLDAMWHEMAGHRVEQLRFKRRDRRNTNRPHEYQYASDWMPNV